MSSSSAPTTAMPGAPSAAARFDRIAVGAVALGLLVVAGPTYYDLLFGRLAADAQGHEPIFLILALWLAWRERETLAALPTEPARLGWIAAAVPGLLLYAFGRSQAMAMAELAAQIPLAIAAILCLKGWRALRLLWFPVFLLLFIVPLPYGVTTTVTGPLKAAVSAVATTLLQTAGYPVGRTGVVITVGQYQLLVAEACAGLQTMFTLEAMGLLYTHLMNYRSAARKALMAVLVVPLSFCANVIRVLVLILVTYHFGDAVGQGFVHGAAGLLLFAVALALISAMDRVLTRALPARWAD